MLSEELNERESCDECQRLRDEHEDQAVRAHLDSAEPVNLLDDELGLELGPQ